MSLKHLQNIIWTRRILKEPKTSRKRWKGYIYIKYSKSRIVQEKQSLVLNKDGSYIELFQWSDKEEFFNIDVWRIFYHLYFSILLEMRGVA